MGAHRQPWYSRGIRQAVLRAAADNDWKSRYRIYVGQGDGELGGTYSEGLARSTFCLVAPGDGWSSRAEDAVLHGCIPVVVMDRVHAVFESVLNWDLFSVRVAEAEVERLPEILAAIPEDKVKRMQARLSKVWHRFAYASGGLLRAGLERVFEQKLYRQRVPDAHPLLRDDALATILQWLHSKAQRGRQSHMA
uniref:Exostosin GT47 domain-containing protein n=1 Tax=Chlamydomonas euryale TaxID=1486919 RepID=A0A7R9V264_9CHLO|mmetsp:Transcript_15347/g.45184  ORF Transcript_15347/g.45184 Transcript_15347/m.45184 type:complete len:193 (+) Transcript_15347:665-1243(+)